MIRTIVNWIALQLLGWANPEYKAKVDEYEKDRAAVDARIQEETDIQVRLASEARIQVEAEAAAEAKASAGQTQLDEILKPKDSTRGTDDDEFHRLSSRADGH